MLDLKIGPMYKYTKRKYAMQLINLGVLRVGTLHDYQSAGHGNGISDSTEGTKTLTHSAVKPLVIEDGHRGDMKVLDDFGITVEPGGRFYAYGANVEMIRNQSTANCFVYCVSSIASKEVMAEFEGTDTCIEITDIQAFLEILTQTLTSVCPVKFVEFNSVEYTERQSKWHPKYQATHPAWIKDPGYSKQKEWRAIWRPLGIGPIKPINIVHTQLTSMIRLVVV